MQDELDQERHHLRSLQEKEAFLAETLKFYQERVSAMEEPDPEYVEGLAAKDSGIGYLGINFLTQEQERQNVPMVDKEDEPQKKMQTENSKTIL
jgi:hypothetical protein